MERLGFWKVHDLDTKLTRVGFGMPKGERNCSESRRCTNQVQILSIILFLTIIISSPNCYSNLSNSSLHLAHDNQFGGYLNPGSFMFVKQHIVHSTPSLLSMANYSYENSLLVRESKIFELEDKPAPVLDKALSLTLAGKLLTNNRPSVANLTYFASKHWECTNRLKAYDHGQGLYTFEFCQDADVHKAISGGPWFIKGKLLLLRKINPLLSITQLVFESTKLWVRCYNLPPKVFNLKFAKAIGDMLGVFCDVDLLEEGNGKMVASRIPTIRKFLRIKVLLKLDVPLKRTQSFKIRNTKANKVDVITTQLAYERLPIFCYRCGVIGHDSDSCSFDGPIIFMKKKSGRRSIIALIWLLSREYG